MAYTKQVKAAAVLNNGFSSSYPGGDGVALFSTAHPLVSGGTNSNTPTTQVDLSETALENAVIQIAGWTDERGLLIAAKPRKLIVPPALQFVATRLLETQLRPGTNDNDVNAIVNNGSIPEGYTINHFLTDNERLVSHHRCTERHEALCSYPAPEFNGRGFRHRECALQST
jgi:hypothetical protein